VGFYSKFWRKIGTKESLCNTISKITGIDTDTLYGEGLELVSVANKMSLASDRQTTRTEDTAYCLLGLFDVNMPLLYGEGQKAFLRLQEEILKSSYDHSLFAWGLDTTSISKFENLVATQRELEREFQGGFATNGFEPHVEESTLRGLLAGSPAAFFKSDNVESVNIWGETHGTPPMIHNRCVYIDLPVILMMEDLNLSIVLLGCRFRHDPSNSLEVTLRKWGEGVYRGRLQELVLIPSNYLEIDKDELIRNDTQRMRIKEESCKEKLEGCFIIKELPSISLGYQLRKVHCVRGARFNRRIGVLWPYLGVNGAQAVLILYNGHGDQVVVVLAKDSSQFEATAAWAYKKQATESQTATEEQLEKLLTGKQKIGVWRLTSDYGRVSFGLKDGGRMVVDCQSQYAGNVFMENVFVAIEPKTKES
jgi:hypothetical protein